MPIAKTRLEVMQVCKLLQCVREKNYHHIEKLVNSGIPHLINYTDPGEGDSALAIAAITNDEDMIKYLLELGAHPDVVDLQGRSAVMKAAEYGHVESFECLTKSGANLKICDLKGRGVLFFCLSPTERHAKCIDVALSHNADVNTKAKDGRTAFFAACETAKDNEETCLALLEKGADPNVTQTATGRTALMMAASSGSARVVREILRKGGDCNAVDKFGRTAGHEAARLGHFEVVVCLGGHGCNFDIYDGKGNNPIHLAANGHAMICKYLGQRGCNPKPKNNDGFQPKNIAKDNGHKDCMKELRKVEKTFGKVGKNNEPWALALYDWSYIRQDELIEQFKKFDPDDIGLIPKDDFVEVVKSQGGPWGDESAKKILITFDKNKDGRVDIKDFLAAKKYINKNYLMAAFEGKKKKKKKGGRGGGKKKKGKPPMDICVMPSEEIMRTMDGGPPIMYIPKHVNYTDNDRFNRDKPPSHPLQDDSVWYLNNPEKQYVNMNDAAKFGDLDSIKNALRRGYSIDTRDKYYKTPLMMACQRGNLEMAKALIEYGANVNAKDNFHWTPLHHACHAGMLDVVELLLNNGASVDTPAMNGSTPLNRAIEASKLNVVQYLVKKGAKMQSETRKGANTLDVAYTWADPRVIDCVRTKFDSLPQGGDKKGGKGGKKGGGRPKTAPGSAKSKSGDAMSKSGPARSPPSPNEEQLHARRKASILRAASALAAGLEEREDITYCPRKPWFTMPTTEELLEERQVRRERFGWESDFPDFEMPFKQNITKRMIEMGGDDD